MGHVRRGAGPRHQSASFMGEPLESRTLLALAVWDGGPAGVGTSWHDAVNWVDDDPPESGDEVLIDTGPGVEFSTGELTLLQLTSSRPIAVLGGTLGVSQSAYVGDQVTLDGGALAGGPWTLAGPGLVVFTPLK